MDQANIPEFADQGYEIFEWRHASAILRSDFPAEWSDICQVLANWRVKQRWATEGGGGRSKIAQEHDQRFYDRGWIK